MSVSLEELAVTTFTGATSGDEREGSIGIR